MTVTTDTITCPNPTKARYATREAAESAARRNQVRLGKLLHTYECDPACGWWHLTSKPHITATPHDIATVERFENEDFRQLVIRDAEHRAPRALALALRDPSVAHRWIQTIKAVQRDLNVEIQQRAKDSDPATREWRATTTALQQVLGDRRREAAEIIAVNPHRRALPRRDAGEKELRAAAGEHAVRRLVTAHRDEFTLYLLQECARIGAEPPASARRWAEENGVTIPEPP